MFSIGKWTQTIKVSFSKHLAYRADFFLQIIAPGIVFFFINFNLWNSIFSKNNVQIIQGYTFPQMIEYHSWVIIIALLSQSHTSFNLAQDIRYGKISTYLVYPIQLWEFHMASFIGFQIIQIFITLITYLFFLKLNFIQSFDLYNFSRGFSITLLVSFLWYSIQYFLGLIAFWLEETWVLRVSFKIIAGFLSGVIIPLELFPKLFVNILNYSPFPYLTFYPVKSFMGTVQNYNQACLILIFWIIIFQFFCWLTWRKGLKLYSAAGM